MEIFQLIQFQAVAELEHMTRAAERLNLAQPALSRTIQNLENELEAPLFDRSGRRMRLNENGRILLRYSRQILSSIQDAKNEITARKAGAETRIRLCVHSATALLPQLLVDFRHARPDIRFEIVQRIFQDTEQPEYDMLIDSIVGDEVLPRSSCLLIQEEVLLAVQSGHPLTGKDGISLSDIREEPFVSLRRDRPWARIIQKACNEVNFTPSIVAESDNPITLCDFVRCGLGVCFLPSRTGLPPAGEGITLLRLKDFAYTRHLYLHWCYNAFLPPHVDAFRQFALAWFAQIEDRGPVRT
ncbi:LysR family transcriptional regulator [Dysosmobacter sp.]